MSGKRKIALAVVLVGVLLSGAAVYIFSGAVSKIRVTAYFDETNNVFVNDEVRILGVAVGKIVSIEPEPEHAKVTFWFDKKYKVPADAKAVIVSPTLVAQRAVELTPVYEGGPQMQNNAVIPLERTAIPMEYDDLREQLEKLAELLQPAKPGGVSTLGKFIDTASDNLQGQGAEIRDAIIKMSQVFSALGDHSKDTFGTFKNLSILVSALRSSGDVLRQLNQNLASVTSTLADDPHEIGNAVSAMNSALGDITTFVAANRESVGATTEKLASVTTALNDIRDDLKQTLHFAPGLFQNYVNIYQPAQGTLTGALTVNNFANPISFLCGAIQAASRRGMEESAKLCVQYLAPIIKNRQYNFPPLGENLLVGATARHNERTYSEDWLRPDYVPPPASADATTQSDPAAAAEVHATDPADGLPGMMIPSGAGS